MLSTMLYITMQLVRLMWCYYNDILGLHISRTTVVCLVIFCFFDCCFRASPNFMLLHNLCIVKQVPSVRCHTSRFYKNFSHTVL